MPFIHKNMMFINGLEWLSPEFSDTKHHLLLIYPSFQA